MATYPLATLVATVTPTGITAPVYSDIYGSLQATFQSIYGSDAVITPDSQDGQLLAIVARAISDANDALIACYRSFSPATAQGDALSSNVKINGIQRGVATNSQVVVRVTGTIGSIISDGIVADALQNKWLLPPEVVIPSAGYVDVTATAQQPGAIQAGVGTITNIMNPQLGWQSVNNSSAASAGAPIELDATLRQRQTTSTAQASQTVLEGIVGAVANLPGVTRVRIFENDTTSTNADGQAANSIAAMVVGGDSAQIANTLMMRKTPGVATVGSTAVTAINEQGIPITIRYTVPSAATITAAITIKALTGYNSTIGDAIKQAIVDTVNATPIGGGGVKVVEYDLVYVAVKNVPQGNTFKIVSMTLTGPGGAGTPDVPLLYNNVASCSTGGVTLTVT